jgi:hypothetical protein
MAAQVSKLGGMRTLFALIGLVLLSSCSELEDLNPFKPADGALSVTFESVNGINSKMRIAKGSKIFAEYNDDGTGLTRRLALEPGTYDVIADNLPSNPPIRAKISVSEPLGNVTYIGSAQVKVDSNAISSVSVSY